MQNPLCSFRGRTAINRMGFSKPVRLALEKGLFHRGSTFLDYGCGRGEDIRQLQRLDIRCYGWDPVFRPNGELKEADVVNLGYVINVIEDFREREHTLRRAWKLTKNLLIVSSRLSIEANQVKLQPYSDGYLTSRGTFQKFYTQKELREWINATLNVRSIPVAPGIFFVFRDEPIREKYEASLYRRRTAVVHYRKSDEVFEEHKGLLQPLMDFFVERGRLPDEFELPAITQIQEVFGSVRQAFAVIKRVTGKEQWTQIEEYKSQDVLIYLALSRFSERPQLSKLPRELQLDIRSFFGTYKKACDTADKLLFSAGDIALIDGACKQATCGKLTREALYIHESALANLSPILRIYEGCARGYIGQVEGANIIKLNRHKPKVSYLSYPKFDKDPHPALAGSLVIDLRTFDVQYYDYSNSENPPILHRKEEFVSAEYPNRTKFESLTHQEERYGLYENTHPIGTSEGWDNILKVKGVRLHGHKLIRV